MNHYEVLEVSQTASQDVIKAAYKSLMLRHHPDRNPGNAEASEYAVRITEAYRVLSNHDARATYDQMLMQETSSINNNQMLVPHAIHSDSLVESISKKIWWLSVLAIFIVLIFWLILQLLRGGEPTGQALGGVNLKLEGFRQESQQGRASMPTNPVEARAIPAYIKNIRVNLAISSESKQVPVPAPDYVLSIQTIDVVVGSFDSDKFISFMNSNTEYISQMLADKLSGARHDILIMHNGDGERYLRQYILNSLGEITGASLYDRQSLPGKPVAHYGVVDILLPDSYAIEQLQRGITVSQ